MKLQLFIIVFFLLSISVSAFEIKGKIYAKNAYRKYFNGETVYLFKNKENTLHEKWDGAEIIDSCVIKDNYFKLSAPNTKNLSTYRVSLKANYLYYFVNIDQDIEVEINDIAKYKCYSVITSSHKIDSIADEYILMKQYRKLEDSQQKSLDELLNKNVNYVFQEFMKKVEAEYFNPYLKRKAINYLKDRIDSEAAIYLAALYSTNIPDRFHAKPFFTYSQLEEVIALIPNKFKNNPYYKMIIQNRDKLKLGYQKPEGYRIKGYMHNVSSNYAVLVLPQKGTAAALIPVDTVEIVNGYFEFTGKVDYPKYGLVTLLGASFHKDVFVENSEIEVNLHSGKTGCNFKNGWLNNKVWGVNFYSYVNGSKANDEYNEFQEISKKGYRYISDWIKKHPKSYPALLHLGSIAVKASPKKSREWIALFDSELKKSPEYKYVIDKIETRERTFKGVTAPNFKLENMKGKKISLRKFRGKYVLIDFWASWCGPCKAEMPNIKEVYQKYKKKGLEVISISSDRSDAAWKKAVKHEKMTWVQLKSGKSSVMKDYGVSGIPHIFLLNKKGEIIASGLRGKNILGEVRMAIDGK